MTTATPERIRRCNRESEFAIAQDNAVLAARPDAKPVGDDEHTVDSFFDSTAHAQVMLNEKFAILASARRNEAAERAEPMRIGVDVPIAPALPKVRMIDASTRLDRVMLVKGISVDFETDRNAIEAGG